MQKGSSSRRTRIAADHVADCHTRMQSQRGRCVFRRLGRAPCLCLKRLQALRRALLCKTKPRAIACESLVLQWNPATAPGGYIVSVSRPVLGTDTAVPPRLLFSSRVSTNEFHIPSPLETGYYEWTVASLGLSGERSAAAAYNYILCAPRTSVPWKSTILSPVRVKAGTTVSPPSNENSEFSAPHG